MPSLDDVYRKFGETAEAAQLLETELGTLLLLAGAIDNGIIRFADERIHIEKDNSRASDLLSRINRQTLGQLLKNLKIRNASADDVGLGLWKALQERNRLSHSFFREHNFRRNSNEGRTMMLADLEYIHKTLLEAYKRVLSLSGIDLDTVPHVLPTGHIPI